jgi:FkbM family methyltransferase
MHNSIILRLKQMLVGTIVGHWLEAAREALELWRAMRSAPERGSRLFQHRCGRLLLSSLCEPERAFVDVGAHIGSVIANVLHACPRMAVIAIEADPEKAGWLSRKFPQIQVHACAAGANEGEVDFEVDRTRPGFSSLAPKRERGADTRRIRVPVNRLDALCGNTGLIGVIKIDVEGMELAVLQGAAEVIAGSRPAIYFESGPAGRAAAGTTAEQLFDWLAHDGATLSREGFAESHWYPQRTLNYFAIPTERRLEIRDRARKILGIDPARRASRLTAPWRRCRTRHPAA